eukprot:gene25158-1655_t
MFRPAALSAKLIHNSGFLPVAAKVSSVLALSSMHRSKKMPDLENTWYDGPKDNRTQIFDAKDHEVPSLAARDGTLTPLFAR